MLHALRLGAAVALLSAPAVASPHPPELYRQIHGRLATPPMGGRISWQFRLWILDPQPIRNQRPVR